MKANIYKSLGRCLVCGSVCPEKTRHEAMGWVWFTGYLPKTVHFCPTHKNNELRERLSTISGKPPESWDRSERNFVEALENGK